MRHAWTAPKKGESRHPELLRIPGGKRPEVFRKREKRHFRKKGTHSRRRGKEPDSGDALGKPEREGGGWEVVGKKERCVIVGGGEGHLWGAPCFKGGRDQNSRAP